MNKNIMNKNKLDQNKKIILLCDYGLDDAVATIFLLDFFGGRRFDIMPIGGNVPLCQSYKNAQTLLAEYEGDKSNIRLIDTFDLPQTGENLQDIHGLDGIGGFLAPALCPEIPVLKYDEFVCEFTTQKQDAIIVSLGPLTVTKKLLIDLGAMELLIMAGNVAEEPNFCGYEFNHALDKPAFDFCVKFPHVIATLDTCRHPEYNMVNKLDAYTNAQPPLSNSLLARLMKKSVELAQKRHPDRCFIYDYIAVRYLANPDEFTTVSKTDPDGNQLNMLIRTAEE